MGITAYHAMAQPGPQQSDCLGMKIDNPCIEADCQGMCLLTKDAGGFGVGYRCACPIGQVILNFLLHDFERFSPGCSKIYQEFLLNFQTFL